MKRAYADDDAPKNPEGKSCPACGGSKGYSYTLTESHCKVGAWGESSEAGDSGIAPRYSLVSCNDCGARFQLKALERKGLAW